MPFIVAFGLAALLTPAVGRAALALGLVDRPGDDALKIHPKPIPVLGGVAVAASALGALAARGGWLPSAVIGAIAVVLAAGLIDDLRPLRPLVRLLLQMTAGAILVAGGFRLEPFGVLGAVGAVALVVVCANAANMVDGQDGLTGGVGAIAALGFAALATRTGGSQAVGYSLAVAGALIGFTLWNRPPAKIFLGNGGADAVGTLLAVSAIMVANQGWWRGLLAAGLCLGVFAFEIVFTVTRRLLAGSSVLPGDRFHSFDLLAAENGDRKKITVLFWGLGLLAAVLAYVVGSIPVAFGLPIAAAACAAAALAGVRLYSLLARRSGRRT
jgi:UDP-GlcNAc:undecaprenyl-phosphate GlcNAc-1-phosphate transferase